MLLVESAMNRLPIAMASVLLMAGASLRGDDAGTIAPGTRLRVFAPTLGRQPLVGVLQSFGADELILAAGGPPRVVVVPRQAVTRVDRSGGRHSRGRWTARGAGLGLLAGVAIGLASGACADDLTALFTFGTCDRGLKAVLGGILGTPTGALIGFAMPPGERWERVPLNQVRSAVRSPSRPAKAVSVTISF